MHLKINSPYLTRFVFSTKQIGPAGARQLINVNGRWRYFFETDSCYTTSAYLAGTVVGTRRERSLPLLCVKVDGRDDVNWIPVGMLRFFYTGGKTWQLCEYRTTIRGPVTEYLVRASSQELVIPPLTEFLRSQVAIWQQDCLFNRGILSPEDAAAYVLPASVTSS
jgi:hypothetical protein